MNISLLQNNGINARIIRLATNERLLFGLLVAFIVVTELVHFRFLTSFPIVFMDEPWNSNASWTWLTEGRNFDAIHAGTLDLFGHEWLMRPYLGQIPWVLSFALFGLGVFQARLVSWVFGIILLLATFLAGYQNYGKLSGILSASFVVVSFPFLNSSHWARQDIMLAALMMLSFVTASYALKNERQWAHFMAGLLLSVSMDVHDNALLFVPGLGLIYLLHYGRRFWAERGFWLVTTGGLSGIIYFLAVHVLPAPEAYVNMRSFYASIRHVPILEGDLSAILSAFKGVVGMFHFYDFPLDFALICAAFLFLVVRWRQPDRNLFVFTRGAVVSFALIQGLRADYYAIILYPLLLLAVGEMFHSALWARPASPETMVILGALLIVFILNSAAHVVRPMLDHRDYDYYNSARQLRDLIPPDARVQGDPIWWLALADYDYTSTLNIPFYDFYLGLSVDESLKKSQADILLIDKVMLGYMNEEQAAQIVAFAHAFADKIGEVQTVENGTVDVYRIHRERFK